MKGIIFLPPAEEEMLDAARFYESRVHGLGREFLAEVQHAAQRITEHPEAATPIRREYQATPPDKALSLRHSLHQRS